MIEREISVSTENGEMQTFVVHPERGVTPVIIFYMDAYGIREELRNMARRLATEGYYVMLPNLYYASDAYELGPIPYPDEEERITRLTQCIQSLSIEGVMADTERLLAHAEADSAADAERVGTVGYCMSGRFAVTAAARYPDRVRSAASFYGTWLVSDDPESPHRAATKATGEIYFACAEIDHWMPLDVVAELEKALREGDANAEVEIYRGVEHAFAFPERRTYDRDADLRHWERLSALFRRNLG